MKLEPSLLLVPSFTFMASLLPFIRALREVDPRIATGRRQVGMILMALRLFSLLLLLLVQPDYGNRRPEDRIWVAAPLLAVALFVMFWVVIEGLLTRRYLSRSRRTEQE
jgi:phosphatidylglycerophosphate synthase